MIKKKRKKVIVTEEVERYILEEEIKICDECNKKVDNFLFSVTTGHNEWENDSDESIDYLDICSKECLLENIDEYYTDQKHDSSYYIVREYDLN